jgi:hypothetical protein
MDRQTERVYAAEDALVRCPVGLTKRELGLFLTDVLTDPLWKKRWKKKKLQVILRSRSSRYAQALIDKRGRPTILLGDSNNRRGIHMVLHEVAHLLVRVEDNHTERFCRTFLYLLGKYAGTYYEKGLRKRFIQTGALRGKL